MASIQLSDTLAPKMMECYKALSSIYIAVTKEVADDLNNKVRAYLKALEMRLDDLRITLKHVDVHLAWTDQPNDELHRVVRDGITRAEAYGSTTNDADPVALKLESMTKDERSLLLYLESCAVDGWGKVVEARMNEEDFIIAHRWVEEGFIEFGMIAYDDIKPAPYPESYWVWLPEFAAQVALAERRARAIRVWEKRTFRKTSEM
jgi:hypothetical protein